MSKTALITGASGGLGLEFSKIFSREEYEDISCIDFTNVAQQSMNYIDYTDTMQNSTHDDLSYLSHTEMCMEHGKQWKMLSQKEKSVQ